MASPAVASPAAKGRRRGRVAWLFGTAWDRARWRLDDRFHPPPASRHYLADFEQLRDVATGSADPAERERFQRELATSGLETEMAERIAQRLRPRYPTLGPASGGWREVLVTLYLAVRARRPRHVVETGIGLVGGTSAFLLQALVENGSGHLWSIDPDKYFDLYGIHVGQAVPERLKVAQTHLVADARDALAPTLASLGSVDLFLHDGLHTYGNMRYEYETAWSHLAPEGLLLSDDVNNSALDDFGRAAGCEVRALRYDDNIFGIATRSGSMARGAPPSSPSQTR